MITINSLAAADSVVIPTQPHYLSAKGSLLKIHLIEPAVIDRDFRGSSAVEDFAFLADIHSLPLVVLDGFFQDFVIKIIGRKEQSFGHQKLRFDPRP